MRTALSSTSVGMPADQKLLVKDAYDVDGSADNTSVIDVLKDVTGDITKAIRTTPGSINKITQLAVDAKTGRLTNQSVMSRITGLIGGTNTLNKLQGHVSNGLAKTFGMDPVLSDKVLTIVRDAAGAQQSTYGRRGSYGNMSNTSSVISAIQRALGNRDVIESLDLGAEAALIGELLNQAVRAGIPSAIDIMLRNAANENQRRYIVTRNIVPILFSGDVATMEATLKYVSPSTIASLRPNFAQDFLANFRMPFNTTKAEYLAYKNRVVLLLRTINPNWLYAKRGESTYLTLEPFVRMSQDAKTVFAMSDEFNVQAMIASGFASKAIGSLVREQYPYFPI